MKTIVTIIFVIIILSTSLFASDEIKIGGMDGLDPYTQSSNNNILLAISGGGARGLTLIGILKAFDENDINIVGIAGTSMGGIIGGLYASGYSPAQLDSISEQLDFNSLFSNSPSRTSMLTSKKLDQHSHLLTIRFDDYKPVLPQGLSAAQRLTTLLTSLTAKANYLCKGKFNNLPISFVTISTDIVTGEQIILDSGSIADAMRATMAFPLAFTGLDQDGRILMDGGIVTPIPVDLARSLNDTINYVVAINTSSQLLGKNELTNPIDLANQVTSIMTSDRLKDQLAKADMVIEPQLNKYSSMDFDKKDTLVKIGYKLGLKMIDSIKADCQDLGNNNKHFIANVEFNNMPPGCAELCKDKLIHKNLTRNEIINILKDIYLSSSLFELTSKNISTSEDSLHLIINGYKALNLSEYQFDISGNSFISDSSIIQFFTDDSNILTSESLRQSIDKIIAYYNKRGYDLVEINDLKIDPLNKIISMSINEGLIYRVDIENNDHTKDWYIRSYFTMKQGTPVSMEKVSQGIKNIYGTDLFDRVTVQLIPHREGVIVKIIVEEKDNTQLRFGWHWNEEYESEEFIELLNDNIGQIGLEGLIHARYSPDRQVYYFSLKADRIFSTYITSRVKLYHDILNRQVYSDSEDPIYKRKEKTYGLSLQAGQQFSRWGTLLAELIAEEKEYEVKETDSKVNLNFIKLHFNSIIETFDQIPFTNHGSKHEIELLLSGEIAGGSEEFTQFYTSHEAYFPLGKYFNYHPRIALGLSRSGLPVTEKFYLGGSHSFTGFRTHQLSGDKMFIFSHELRANLPFNLYFTLRYDMGEVYDHTDQIKLRNLRNSFGAMMAVDLPIGPIEFGYGIANSDIDRFYLNIGFNF